MHNMIVENERPEALSWEDYLHMNVEVTDDTVCQCLQMDLIEHQ
jgi:hypothetical protein